MGRVEVPRCDIGGMDYYKIPRDVFEAAYRDARNRTAAAKMCIRDRFLTMICRTLAIPIVHAMDAAAEKGDFKGIEMWQILAILMVKSEVHFCSRCFNYACLLYTSRKRRQLRSG